jgi:thiosulfate/3-mercaptopyruvate sulfurtransferase
MRMKLAIVMLFALSVCAVAQQSGSKMPQDISTISAQQLAAILDAKGTKPLVLQVGPQMLYRTAHIQGAEYAGMAAEPAGLQKLRVRVQKLKRTAEIVIYCGCCPWEHCPNIHPAYAELHKMGFTNVKALYLPNNFKTDWHDKGYPTQTGD